jgi:hypothetical protein
MRRDFDWYGAIEPVAPHIPSMFEELRLHCIGEKLKTIGLEIADWDRHRSPEWYVFKYSNHTKFYEDIFIKVECLFEDTPDGGRYSNDYSCYLVTPIKKKVEITIWKDYN